MIDAPTEDLEDDECEDVSEDEGAQCDDEGELDDDADLGWTVDGVIGVNDEGKDEDFVTPETSGGFARPAGHYGAWITHQQHEWMRAQFDPRIGRRPAPGSRFDENSTIPPFPHESDDRPPFDLWREIPRLLTMAARLRRTKKRDAKRRFKQPLRKRP